MTFLDAVRERVVVFDGATGTNLAAAGLGPEDYGRPEWEGCHEILNLTRPDAVAALHASFLEAGVDVVETNSFGGFAVPLAEYGLAGRAEELCRAAAVIAREVAGGYSTHGEPRWVAGSLGPGTRSPTLGHLRYADLRRAYQASAAGLLAGGVDLITLETAFDLLGLKAAVAGARDAMGAAGREVPLQVQVTIEAGGWMLLGTDIAAALAALDPLRPDVIGINCGTGPEHMYPALRHLSRHSRRPIACIPNAGMPEVVEGRTCYSMSPEGLAAHHAAFVTGLGVSVVGGCCGTTPAHLRAVVERCRGLAPAPRAPAPEPGASSTFGFVPFSQEASYLIIGERTNANGSQRFRRALQAGDWAAGARMAREQAAESAHLVDLCVDYVGRDGTADMDALAARFATAVDAPVVLDSSEPEVMQAGLERLGGRSVLNSANLEDGDGPGSRFDRVMSLARDHGAAVICLLIDEEGQARDVAWKLRVAHRIHRLAARRYGLEGADLLFDALTFPAATGDESLRGDAAATLEAIRRIKAEIPGARTVLGVSNVSFGLRPAARQVLNSVFLHEAAAAGLDAAIIHAGRILPGTRIPPEQVEACLDLIYDRRRPSADPLARVLSLLDGAEGGPATAPVDRSAWPVEQRLQQRIVDADAGGLTPDLDEALAAGIPPLSLINGPLLGGMRRVGDLFAAGEMQLPFVMHSAEVMKAALAHLEPHLDKEAQGLRGTVVLATVKGDVHDIGKNLAGIMLANHGYRVHDLGIKVNVDRVVEAVAETGADAVGMSGLLVKSTLVMRDNLEELARRGLGGTPVLLGGAALTRAFVENDLHPGYPGPLFYCKDAFAGLEAMEAIVLARRGGGPVPRPPRQEGRPRPAPSPAPTGPTPARSELPQVPIPPFLGSRVVAEVPLDGVLEHLDRNALYHRAWRFHPEPGETPAGFDRRMGEALASRLEEAAPWVHPAVVYGYFPAGRDGDDLLVRDGTGHSAVLTRFRFPRQAGDPFRCLADYWRTPEEGEDYAAFQVVTIGEDFAAFTAGLRASGRYNDYFLAHGLGAALAEALADHWHARIRAEWALDGSGPAVGPAGGRGARYSWGYPACPDLEDNAVVARLLEADRIGVRCGPETGFQYHPELTTSALVSHHPDAVHFTVGAGQG